MNDPILVLGAMDGEIVEFVKQVTTGRREMWHGFEIHRGTMEGRDVVVARSGVGKSMAACVTQHLVDTYSPGAIVFTGLAGGLRPDLEIGDTVVARDCIQHDLDATALGFKRGEIPYTQYRVLTCDEALVSLAAGVDSLQGRTVVGRVLTGDQFLVASEMKADEMLRSDLAGDVVEMEGASVGLVAQVNEIPFLVIRTVSDTVRGGPRVDFVRFLSHASRNSLHFVSHVLKRLPGT